MSTSVSFYPRDLRKPLDYLNNDCEMYSHLTKEPKNLTSGSSDWLSVRMIKRPMTSPKCSGKSQVIKLWRWRRWRPWMRPRSGLSSTPDRWNDFPRTEIKRDLSLGAGWQRSIQLSTDIYNFNWKKSVNSWARPWGATKMAKSCNEGAAEIRRRYES